MKEVGEWSKRVQNPALCNTGLDDALHFVDQCEFVLIRSVLRSQHRQNTFRSKNQIEFGAVTIVGDVKAAVGDCFAHKQGKIVSDPRTTSFPPEAKKRVESVRLG